MHVGGPPSIRPRKWSREASRSHLPPRISSCQENALKGKTQRTCAETSLPEDQRHSPNAPVALFYRRIINARDSSSHQPVRIEVPQLNTVRPKPLARIVMPLVFETHRDPVLIKCPKRLLQSVIQFPSPLAIEKRLDLLTPRKKLRSIPPFRINGVRQYNPFRIAS